MNLKIYPPIEKDKQKLSSKNLDIIIVTAKAVLTFVCGTSTTLLPRNIRWFIPLITPEISKINNQCSNFLIFFLGYY